jgi:hypothetical protein
MGPGGPRSYGAQPTGPDPSRAVPPFLDEAALASAPAWVTRAISLAAERAAADPEKHLRYAALQAFVGGPAGQTGGAGSAGQPPGVTRPARPSRPPAARPGRRRKVRFIWVFVLLFILLFNTVSSCVRTEINHINRAPTPAPSYQIPEPGN